jgi:hypothetical protein
VRRAGVCARLGDRARAALAEVAARHGGMDPRHNPLLLVCALIVFGGDGGALPESPARLYDRIVAVLCDTRGKTHARARAAAEPRGVVPCLAMRGRRRRGGAGRAGRAAVAQGIARSLCPDATAARDALDRLYEDTGLLQFEAGGRGALAGARMASQLSGVLRRPCHHRAQRRGQSDHRPSWSSRAAPPIPSGRA